MLIRIATIKGPPASPSFTGCGIPGRTKGILPRIIPAAIPRNIAIRFGYLSLFCELPIIFAAASTASGVPSTVRRSPI